MSHGIDFRVINEYRAMDAGELARVAYRMEKTLEAIQLRKVQDPAILAGQVVAEVRARRSPK